MIIIMIIVVVVIFMRIRSSCQPSQPDINHGDTDKEDDDDDYTDIDDDDKTDPLHGAPSDDGALLWTFPLPLAILSHVHPPAEIKI